MEGNWGYICLWFLYFSLSESCVPILKNEDLFIFQIYITYMYSFYTGFLLQDDINQNRSTRFLVKIKKKNGDILR